MARISGLVLKSTSQCELEKETFEGNVNEKSVIKRVILTLVTISAQAAGPGSVGSVPNPFMNDFPPPNTNNPPPPPGNNATIGMFDNESRNSGGDLFSGVGQADMFGGDSAMIKTTDIVEGVGADFVHAGNNVAQNNGQSSSTGSMSHTPSLVTGKSNATPPPRPPPPGTIGAAPNDNSTPTPMSPAIGASNPAGRQNFANPNKSAFDDLNDSIRMALGGSPSRPSSAASQTTQSSQQQQSIPNQQSQQLQQQSTGFTNPRQIGGWLADNDIPPVGNVSGLAMTAPPTSGQNVMGPATNTAFPQISNPTSQLPVGYGSPAKQPMSGDGNQLN